MADIELEVLSRAIMVGGIDQLIAAGIEVDLLRNLFSRIDFDGPVPEHRPDLGPCWVCRRGIRPNGYGDLSYRGKKISAHRLAFTLFVGDIPDGLDLDHLCRNRACVRPYHLEPATRLENLVRGDGVITMLNAQKTHCVNGHEFTEENTYLNRGYRHCKTCRRIAKRKHRNG